MAGVENQCEVPRVEGRTGEPAGLHIGVIGGGQLGQMLGLAGVAMGHRFTFLDPAFEPPAASVGRHIRAEFDDAEALERLAVECDVVTLEFENVPQASAERVAARNCLMPGTAALAVAQDRLEEKQFFEGLGLTVAPWVQVDSVRDIVQGVAHLGGASILKTRRFGYDGKGQVRLADPAHAAHEGGPGNPGEAASAWEAIGGVPAVLEKMQSFEREVSIVAVRSRSGEQRVYPLVTNVHRHGILWQTTAHRGDPLQAEAERAAGLVLEKLDYVGALTIEFFVVDGRLVINEMAPRVHNSGHWSLGGARTSQFENHLRALLGWPLGDTDPLGEVAMLNLVGRLPDPMAVMAVPGTSWHDYGKTPRPGRKLGHVTVTAPDDTALESRLDRLRGLITPPGD
ncbi:MULTISPECIES: 5-(carboxyamino)imidazole ribonucleotide synthase [unclassified Guyparkeria]|uniref:5-(carboxyamino)imidazole ribonucleotide synthase n=1 Tax=unclassified Guyparkeria TaxID=2626246 RepID=UPI000A467D7C|nr:MULTISPECIES: 5-(carboxyamino)imidazole ribonucleotide synthase [unclassified Guyparkeria]